MLGWWRAGSAVVSSQSMIGPDDVVRPAGVDETELARASLLKSNLGAPVLQWLQLVRRHVDCEAAKIVNRVGVVDKQLSH